MIERADIEKAYIEFLGRRPESDAVVEAQRSGHANVAEMRRSVSGSTEAKAHAVKIAKRPGTVLGPGDLHDFVLETDRIGALNSDEVQAFWADVTYRPTLNVDDLPDPYSEAYVARQIEVYSEMSGRALDQVRHEMLAFDPSAHEAAPNPYAHWSPALVALHTARIARAVQYAGLRPGDLVADIGCGWGFSCELMAMMGLRVIGVDINPAFVALVNRRASRLGNRVEALVGSFEAIPGAGLFDAALFYESLHHAVRPWAALEAVHSRLCSGGKLLLAGEPVNDIWEHWGIRTDLMSVYCVRKFGWFESGWSAAFLKGCVKGCGFRIDHFAAEPNDIGWVMAATKCV